LARGLPASSMSSASNMSPRKSEWATVTQLLRRRYWIIKR
jgi:hypothetical protein